MTCNYKLQLKLQNLQCTDALQGLLGEMGDGGLGERRSVGSGRWMIGSRSRQDLSVVDSLYRAGLKALGRHGEAATDAEGGLGHGGVMEMGADRQGVTGENRSLGNKKSCHWPLSQVHLAVMHGIEGEGEKGGQDVIFEEASPVGNPCKADPKARGCLSGSRKRC